MQKEKIIIIDFQLKLWTLNKRTFYGFINNFFKLNDVNVAIGFYSRNKGIRANSIGTLNIAILFTDFTYTQSLKIYILEIRMVN